MHPRNKHQEKYNFEVLTKALPALKQFVRPNKYGVDSIDFANPEGVKTLNTALLKSQYGVDFWEIPQGYLCPPIPGRADYIHHIADVLAESNFGNIPEGKQITCLDVGVGANCIYPLIGVKEYGWSFIASEVDETAYKSAKRILIVNKKFTKQVELIHQHQPKKMLHNIINQDSKIDVVISNPPFHASAAEALASSTRKVRNLSKEKVDKLVLNFGGRNNELWCEGGERAFVINLIKESKHFEANAFWFSSLVSKQKNLKAIYAKLNSVEALEVKTIPMGQGNKSSRLVAWTFLTKEEQANWRKEW